MKLAGFSRMLSILYNDKMDVYRTTSQQNRDSTTDIFYSSDPIKTDIPCRISFSHSDTSTDSEIDMNPVRYSPKIFTSASEDLKAGDYVVIRRYNDNGQLVKTYSGLISDPSWYVTHQEIFMRIDEGA